MSGGPFACFPKSYLRKLNLLVQKPRTVKRSRVKQSLKSVLRRNRMSKDHQLDNAKLAERKKKPAQKIKCLSDTESERISLLLSRSHHELFTPHLSEDEIKKKILRLAKAHAFNLGIKSEKINELWLTSYFEKFKHLLVNTEQLGHINDLSDAAISSVSQHATEKVGFKSQRPKGCTAEVRVSNLATLFETPKASQVFTRLFSKRKFTDTEKTDSLHYCKVAKLCNNHPFKDHVANISEAQSTVKRKIEQSMDRLTFAPIKKKHMYEDSSINPLLRRKLLHPRRTGCVLIAKDSHSFDSNERSRDDVPDDLFCYCSDLKDRFLLPSFSKDVVAVEENKVLHESDDCDSGYRSRGDSQDIDALEMDAVARSAPNQPDIVTEIFETTDWSPSDNIEISSEDLDTLSSFLNLNPS